ncbi:uncharacterized protein LOC144200900 [Stigmatopora nigra]
MNKRKFSLEDSTTKTTSTGLPETKHKLSKTNVTRSTDGDIPIWKKENLSSGEELWALTLQAALPYYDEQDWEEIPDFPHPSAREVTSELQAENKCSSLNQKVPKSLKSQVSQKKPDFLVLLAQQDKTELDIADTSHSSLSRQDCGSKTIKASIEKDQTYVDAVAGPSGIGAGMEKNENRPPVQGSCLDRMRDADMIEVIMESEEEEDEEKDFHATKSGEQAQEKLNTCPMCLVAFPVESSQMDRDSHLAQCLSEMNVDMSW